MERALESGRRSGQPLYRAVLEQIERTLEAEVAPGAKLPSETALARLFGVHRNTVSKIMAELRGRGLIESEAGRGHFRKERLIAHPVGPRTRLRSAIAQLNRRMDREVVASRTIRASRELAELLRVPYGHYLRRVDCRNTVDGVTMSVSSHHFPLPRFHGVDAAMARAGSITAALSELGVERYSRSETRIRAVPLSARQAAELRQPCHRHGLLMVMINVDESGVPIQAGYATLSGQRIEFVVRFDDAQA